MMFAVLLSFALVSAIPMLVVRFRRQPMRWAEWSGLLALLAGGLGLIMACLPLNPVWSVFAGIPLALLVVAFAAITARRRLPSVWRLSPATYWLIAGLALPASATWIAYDLAGPGYWAEFNYIKAKLAAIPGVRVIEMGGNRDFIYEDIWARLAIEGKGKMTLMGLTPASLRNTSNLAVARIDEFSFRKVRWGYGAVVDRDGQPVWSKSVGFTLNVGPDGDFSPTGRLAGRFDAEIRNIQQLIDRYEPLVAALENLRHEDLFFRNEDGSTVEYLISTKADRARRQTATR